MPNERNPPAVYPKDFRKSLDPIDFPREPFIFTDPDEVSFFSAGDHFTLHRYRDGVRFTFYYCKPEFHDNAVTFHVDKAMVTWL